MLMRTDCDIEARPVRPTFAARAADLVWSLVERIENYFECRRQMRGLMALDDRMLKDIGLSRADISRISALSGQTRLHGLP